MLETRSTRTPRTATDFPLVQPCTSPFSMLVLLRLLSLPNRPVLAQAESISKIELPASMFVDSHIPYAQLTQRGLRQRDGRLRRIWRSLDDSHRGLARGTADIAHINPMQHRMESTGCHYLLPTVHPMLHNTRGYTFFMAVLSETCHQRSMLPVRQMQRSHNFRSLPYP